MRPSPAVIVSSGPIGVAPCDTHGSSSMPSKRTPTAPPPTTCSPRNSAAVAAHRARARDAAEHRHARRARRAARSARRRSETSTGSGSRIAPPAPERSGMPRIATPSATSWTSAWNVDTAPSLERRGPHRHRRAALDLAPAGDDAARAAADQHVGREHVVDALDRRARAPRGARRMRTRRRDRCVEPSSVGGGLRGRLERSGVRVGGGRQPARDAHRHGLTGRIPAAGARGCAAGARGQRPRARSAGGHVRRRPRAAWPRAGASAARRSRRAGRCRRARARRRSRTPRRSPRRSCPPTLSPSAIW